MKKTSSYHLFASHDTRFRMTLHPYMHFNFSNIRFGSTPILHGNVDGRSALGRTYVPSIPVLTVAVVCENLKYTSYVVCTNTLHMWSLILWPFKLFKYCSYRVIILSSNLSIFQNVLKMMKSSFLDSLAVKSLNSIEICFKFIKKLEFRPLSGLQGCNSAARMVHSTASLSHAPSRWPRCSLSGHLKCLNSNFFIPLNQFSISSCLLTVVRKENNQ